MANDTPFVPLPSPPRSPTQTDKDADKRGYDFGPTADDDDHARAVAYVQHIKNLAADKKAKLLLLKGNNDAAKNLNRKTLALSKGSPAHIEGL